MIRVDAVWLAVQPLDMRLGTEAALARVVGVFGAANPNHAYLFANRRGTRMKVLIHDGHGIWLAHRRLNQGRFHWRSGSGTLPLTRAQFDVLILVRCLICWGATSRSMHRGLECGSIMPCPVCAELLRRLAGNPA